VNIRIKLGEFGTLCGLPEKKAWLIGDAIDNKLTNPTPFPKLVMYMKLFLEESYQSGT